MPFEINQRVLARALFSVCIRPVVTASGLVSAGTNTRAQSREGRDPTNAPAALYYSYEGVNRRRALLQPASLGGGDADHDALDVVVGAVGHDVARDGGVPCKVAGSQLRVRSGRGAVLRLRGR